MIVGFNHNVTYHGVCFHVQTEDSGIRSPHLITLLYHGGTIICSQKTSYADIVAVDDLESVVEDLAKEQHKGMLRRLKRGEFDQRIGELGIQLKPVTDAEQQGAAAPPTPGETTNAQLHAAGAEEVEAGDAEVAVSTPLEKLVFAYLSGENGPA